jgi:hypothetical protein
LVLVTWYPIIHIGNKKKNLTKKKKTLRCSHWLYLPPAPQDVADLLEKSYNELEFEQNSGLVVPCSVSTFQEVLNAVEGSKGKFDFENLLRSLFN